MDESPTEQLAEPLAVVSAGFQPLAPTLSIPEIHRLSPAALAYLGDSVYELYIRRCYLFPPRRSPDYHHQVVQQVKAETQADYLRALQPYLTELELDILRRGRNAAKRAPKRLDPEIYQQATSFETLVGYLYLTDPPRLWLLLSQLRPVSSFSV